MEPNEKQQEKAKKAESLAKRRDNIDNELYYCSIEFPNQLAWFGCRLE